MNIALEKTEEFVNGQLRRSYGDAFVRGNNGEQNHGLLLFQ
jgi:U6 snRNA-associated Sm-like protein LSm6